MRVCPNCGHRDLPFWRNSRFYFNVDVARLDDLDVWGLEFLVAKLKEDGYYEDGHFAYLLGSGGKVVLRKEIELLNKDTQGNEATAKKEKWFQISIEKARKRKDSSQTKLLKVAKEVK